MCRCCTLQIWDARSKRVAQVLPGRYPMTSVAYGIDSNTVFCGGIDNAIDAWDLRKVGPKQAQAHCSSLN